MRSKYLFVSVAIIFVFTIFGCSSSSNPIDTSGNSQNISKLDSLPVGVTDDFPDGTPSEGFGAMGLFSLQINQSDMTAELATLRKSSLTDVLEVVDISNFLQMAPCHDCAKVESVRLNNDGNLVVSIGIKHPFPAGDLLKPITGQNRADLHVFNVEGIVISNSEAFAFPGIEKSVAGFRLLNADGFTGYLDGVLDGIYPTAASVHPYITHFDDYSSGNYDPMSPTGFTSVVDPPPSGNLVMAMGCDYDYQDYIFNVDGSFDFIFAVGCTYAVSSASKSQRFSPEYRVPQHNKKAASEVSLAIITNELAGEDISSTAEIEIRVVDINHGVSVGDALNQMLADSSVSGITIEIPGVLSSPLVVDISSPSGLGHDPSDPLIYPVTITNSAGGAEGTYTGLVKVTDSYTPGLNQLPLLNGQDGIQRVDPFLNPLDGLFAITEFATYQVFSIDVATGALITVITPNGGEEWAVGSDQEITWTSQNVTGTVFIEYSKDNFIADIHPIAADEANDDSFMWENIPNDPSDTVRVRISSTDNPGVNDISDEDFSIYVPAQWSQLQNHASHVGDIGDGTGLYPPLKLEWSVPFDAVASPAWVEGTPIVGDGKIMFFYMTGGTNWAECRSLEDGAFLWKFNLSPGGSSSPISTITGCYADGRFFAPGNVIRALDPETGTQLWEHPGVSAWENQRHGLAYDDERIIVHLGNRIYLIDAETGATISNISAYSGYANFQPLTIVDNVAYYQAGRHFRALDLATESQLWSFQVDPPHSGIDDSIRGTATVPGDGKVYFGCYNFYYYALNQATGVKEWSILMNGGTQRTFDTSAYYDGKIYYNECQGSNPSRFVCLDANDGTELWNYPASASYTSPIVADGVVYNCGGGFCGLDADTGDVLWSYSPSASAGSDPVIVDGKLLFMSTDSKLWCFVNDD